LTAINLWRINREIEFDDKEQELLELRHKLIAVKQEQSKIEDQSHG